MRRHTDGPHTGTSTTVGNAERFVKVEVAYDCTEITGPANAHHGIHVCAVEVNLSPCFMNQIADFTNRRLKDTMGRRVGHHQGGEFCGVVRCLGP